jgi:hypothetical protein
MIMKQILTNISILCFSICFLTGTVGIEIFHHICHQNNVQLISINKEEKCSSIVESNLDDCCKTEKILQADPGENCCDNEIQNGVLSYNRVDHCKSVHQIIKLDESFLLPQNSIPLLIAPVQIDFSIIEFRFNDIEFYFSKLKSQLPDFSSPRDWIIKFLQIAISNFSTGEEPARIY